MVAEEYYIECEDCGTKITTGSNVQKLLENLMRQAARNNLDSTNAQLCEEAKENVSFDDLQSSFANGQYRVYKATEFEHRVIEWEPQECRTEEMSE